VSPKNHAGNNLRVDAVAQIIMPHIGCVEQGYMWLHYGCTDAALEMPCAVSWYDPDQARYAMGSVTIALPDLP
jgi:hypothetical protein